MCYYFVTAPSLLVLVLPKTIVIVLHKYKQARAFFPYSRMVMDSASPFSVGVRG